MILQIKGPNRTAKITGFETRVTRRVPHVVQELLTLPVFTPCFFGWLCCLIFSLICIVLVNIICSMVLLFGYMLSVYRKGKQFLHHMWYPSCYSCFKPGDFGCPIRPFDFIASKYFWIIWRSSILNFSPNRWRLVQKRYMLSVFRSTTSDYSLWYRQTFLTRLKYNILNSNKNNMDVPPKWTEANVGWGKMMPSQWTIVANVLEDATLLTR
jgi:hypothetical protein